VGRFVGFIVQFTDDFIAFFGINHALGIFSLDVAHPLMVAEVTGFPEYQVAPLRQEVVTDPLFMAVGLENGEDEMGIRVHQFVELFAGGTLPAGILLTLVCTGDVTGVGQSQGQTATTGCSCDQLSMWQMTASHRFDELAFQGFLAYDVTEVHGYDCLCKGRADKDSIRESRTALKAVLLAGFKVLTGGDSILRGSMGCPFLYTLKSRWGPVDKPVEPTYPMRCPCSTLAPLRMPVAKRDKCM